MASPRSIHTATRVANGLVLVIGGYVGSNYLATAEVYNPASGTWSPASSMTHIRPFHASTLLPNGKVLVVGGNGFPHAELYTR